jgi:hypothetical protein
MMRQLSVTGVDETDHRERIVTQSIKMSIIGIKVADIDLEYFLIGLPR